MTHPTSPRLPLGRARGHTARRSVTLAALLAAMLVPLGALAPSAGAHTTLESSDPADGGTVDRPPASVQLVFGGPVSAAAPVLTITVAGSDPVEAPAVIDGDTVTADLSAVELPGVAGASYPASWQVGYRLVASDGDPFSGDIAFTVAGPPDTASAPPAAVPAPTVPTSTAPAITPEVSAAAPGTTDPDSDSEQSAAGSASAPGTIGTIGTEPNPEVSAAAPGTADSGDQGEATSPAAAAATDDGAGSAWWWAAGAVLALVAGVAVVHLRKRRADPPTG